MRIVLMSLLMGIYGCNGINYYDKYLNRDISSLILRKTEVPFYSSDKLYSSHYVRINILDIPNKNNNNTNIDIKK